MEKKYYNKVTRQFTRYKYRIKTIDEFIAEFGNNWMQIVRATYVDDMLPYIGLDFEIDDIDIEEEPNGSRRWLGNWNYSFDMITPNICNMFESIYLKEKRLIYS